MLGFAAKSFVHLSLLRYYKDNSHTKRANKFEYGSGCARIGETYMGRFLRLKLHVLQEPVEWVSVALNATRGESCIAISESFRFCCALSA